MKKLKIILTMAIAQDDNVDAQKFKIL